MVGQFCHDHDLIAITDEIYEYIVYPGAEHISLASLPVCSSVGRRDGCADGGLSIGLARVPARSAALIPLPIRWIPEGPRLGAAARSAVGLVDRNAMASGVSTKAVGRLSLLASPSRNAYSSFNPASSFPLSPLVPITLRKAVSGSGGTYLISSNR